jgi:hypothetical protein
MGVWPSVDEPVMATGIVHGITRLPLCFGA